MTRKPKNQSKALIEAKKSLKASEKPWGGFLNLRLTDEQKSDYEKWMLTESAAVWDLLVELLADGAKLSLSYDEQNDSYVASLTGDLVPGELSRYCATSRAETVGRSIMLIAYKHLIMAERDWSDFKPRSSTLSRFE